MSVQLSLFAHINDVTEKLVVETPVVSSEKKECDFNPDNSVAPKVCHICGYENPKDNVNCDNCDTFIDKSVESYFLKVMRERQTVFIRLNTVFIFRTIPYLDLDIISLNKVNKDLQSISPLGDPADRRFDNYDLRQSRIIKLWNWLVDKGYPEAESLGYDQGYRWCVKINPYEHKAEIVNKTTHQKIMEEWDSVPPEMEDLVQKKPENEQNKSVRVCPDCGKVEGVYYSGGEKCWICESCYNVRFSKKFMTCKRCGKNDGRLLVSNPYYAGFAADLVCSNCAEELRGLYDQAA